VGQLESETVANLVQNMYIHGSTTVQNGLTYMTNGMMNTIYDMHNLRKENASLLERNSLLEVAHKDNAIKLEKIEEIKSKLTFAKNSTIPTLQVQPPDFVTTPALTNIFQAEIDKWQEKYDALVDTVSEMEKSSSQAETLKSELDAIRNRFDDVDKKLNSTQTKFNDASTKLSACLHIFKVARRTFRNLPTRSQPCAQEVSEPKKHSFPVLQANGVMVDFTKVVAAWAKAASDGENQPYRSYTCPITNTVTTLAHLSISSRFQGECTRGWCQVAFLTRSRPQRSQRRWGWASNRPYASNTKNRIASGHRSASNISFIWLHTSASSTQTAKQSTPQRASPSTTGPSWSTSSSTR
jgi:hypothetical protein